MGNDVDDALALAMIHALEDAGKCRLLGILLSKDNPWSAVYTDLVNTFCGASGIPIGTVGEGATPDDGKFVKRVSQAHGLNIGSGKTENAVTLLRRLLSGQPDRSVVVITIGFFTNLSRFLDSPPDEISSYHGLELLSQKVSRIYSMAGCFRPSARDSDPGYHEYNIGNDVEAAEHFLRECPVPIVFSGYEIGENILFPGQVIATALAENRPDPVSEAYALFAEMPYDRPCWDQTVVLQAIRPEASYFRMSEPGTVRVDQSGGCHFSPHPDGLHQYLILDQSHVSRILREMIDLCSGKLGGKARGA